LDNIIEKSLVDTKLMLELTSVKNYENSLNSPSLENHERSTAFSINDNSTNSNLESVKRKLDRDKFRKEQELTNMIESEI
jgi:hypothetical protein